MCIESREAHIYIYYILPSFRFFFSISFPITNMSKNCDRIKMFNNCFSPLSLSVLSFAGHVSGTICRR